MKVLFIGDIVGKVGRNAVKAFLPSLTDKYKVDMVIANGENIAGGFGLTESLVRDLYAMGVHVITTGNHVWDKKDFVGYISKDNRVLRPANFAPGVPGFGSLIHTSSDGTKVGVLNLSGRVFMANVDCPFRKAEAEISTLAQETNIIIIDLHAEATSEKVAFGYFVDGKVSAVIGTHTHVQTADEKILQHGTAYITDVGMTGPAYSVIGIEVEQIIQRFLTGMPDRFETAQGKGILSAVVIDINAQTGKASGIQRIQLSYP
ncbi:MAG TPA: TIGR00282 family metallophosphoesterase [Thermodesulfovibrionales bacterium]|nr:TIGR00282 family metallophosphoesterase [Thermodesulfovibrionales bacterium]